MGKSTKPWEENWVQRDRIGRGGQGETFICRSRPEPEKSAVLKCLRNNKSEQARRRMYQEVANLRVVRNAGANVPSVLESNADQFEDKDAPLFVVMEYVPGRTLDEIVKENGPLTIDKAVAVVRQLCDTVRIAHANKVIHRDIKPQNIIVRDIDGPDVVIVDYGLSFNSDFDGEVTATNETFRNEFLSLPETNTPGGDRRDYRSDVTALCAILYFCLAGHPVGQLRGSDDRPPHRRVEYGVREKMADDQTANAFEALFDAGFSFNVDARFQTVDELLGRLEIAARSQSASDPEDPTLFAARMSARLRQQDRRTQLQAYRKAAETVFTAIGNHAMSLANKLESFHVQVARAEFHDGLEGAFDAVPGVGIRIVLNIAHYDYLRAVDYRVVARGGQCLLLRRRAARLVPNNQIEPTSPWEDVYWFAGDIEPNAGHAIRDVNAQMNKSMEDLFTDVAAHI